MLDLSKVPVIDSDVTIRRYASIHDIRCIKLEDVFSNSTLYLPESMFNKYFKAFKNVLKNEEMYREKLISSRGHKWFRPKDIDISLSGSDYFMLDRVPIYIEMFKHISKYKVRLDRDSLLSQNICVLKAVNNKIKKRKKLNKIENLPYINL